MAPDDDALGVVRPHEDALTGNPALAGLTVGASSGLLLLAMAALPLTGRPRRRGSRALMASLRASREALAS